MDEMNITEHIVELEREIAALPPGSITPKKIRGKDYFYHRYSQNGKRIENYIDADQVDALRIQIQRRKELEAELKQLKRSVPIKHTSRKKRTTHKFRTYVRVGEQLSNWAAPVQKYKQRECYSALYNFVFGEQQDKVFILYGLRRTGKTTMLRQLVLNMTDTQLNHTAFIQISTRDSLSAVNADLKYLEQQGYRYVFLDEVTLMDDFIEGAALFSDIYASSGMKIVLSGTDSLGFVFTEHEQLYDRCVMLHTTFISYREFENVLGIKGIDTFIRYGGTMSMGGVHYNTDSPFATKENTDEYIDSAIAQNIQHSLKYYQNGGHFRLLYDLYQNGELTSAINRVVEDLNHRFTREVLTRTFKSSTLSGTASNLLRDRTAPMDLMEHIDQDFALSSIKGMLDILEKEEQTVDVDDSHAAQIKEYLTLLDLVMEIDLLHFPNTNTDKKKIVLTQPGMRYAQTEALVRSLLADQKFNMLSAVERSRVLERVMGTIQGRMMEDQVLLETKLAHPDKQVFQLQFAVGEFDMVISDPQALTCELYEIKYSKGIFPQQYQHLIDHEKCAQTEHRFGTITGRFVIYRGDAAESDGIRYLNVEDYLKSIG